MITATDSDQALKWRLKNKNRCERIEANQAEFIKRMLDKGISKKALCKFYSCTYETLKQVIKK